MTIRQIGLSLFIWALYCAIVTLLLGAAMTALVGVGT